MLIAPEMLRNKLLLLLLRSHDHSGLGLTTTEWQEIETVGMFVSTKIPSQFHRMMSIIVEVYES